MKNLYYIFFFLLLSVSISGQSLNLNESRIDSLKQIVARSNEDSSRARIYLDISNEIITTYKDSTETYKYFTNKSLEIINKNLLENEKKFKETFLELKIKATDNLAYYEFLNKNYDKAIKYLDVKIALCKKLKKHTTILESLLDKAEAHAYNMQFKDAISLFDQIIKDQYFDSLRYQKQLYALNFSGMVYHRVGMFEKAEDAWNKFLNAALRFQDPLYIANAYGQLAYYYSAHENIEKSFEYNSLIVALVNEQNLDIRMLPQPLSGIADYYFYKKKNKIGLEYLLKADSINEITENNRMFTLSLLGSYYEKKEKNYLKSIQYYHLAEKEAMMHKDIESVGRIYSNMHRVYSKSKNYKKAYEYALKYFETREKELVSVTEAKNLEVENLLNEKIKADSLNFEKDNQINSIKLAKQKAELKSNQNQKYGLYTGLLLVLIFSGFIYNRFKVTKTQKSIIEKAHIQLEEKNQEITDSIHYAKRIQSAILPPNKLVDELLPNSFIIYKPKDIVAGDFYWLEHKEDKVLFAACDCTGHGVPGAMVSVICNNGLNRAVREHHLTDPGKILDKTKEIVIQEFEKSEEEVKDGMDIALCSLQGNKFHFAGANNPLWIIRKGAEEIQEIKADKQPIGKYAEPTPYTTHQIELEKGDTIYIFSDGYVDQFGGEKGKKFKAAKFKKLLLSIQNETIEQQRELINQAFEDWKGDLEQLDDVCVIGVKV